MQKKQKYIWLFARLFVSLHSELSTMKKTLSARLTYRIMASGDDVNHCQRRVFHGKAVYARRGEGTLSQHPAQEPSGFKTQAL